MPFIDSDQAYSICFALSRLSSLYLLQRRAMRVCILSFGLGLTLNQPRDFDHPYAAACLILLDLHTHQITKLEGNPKWTQDRHTTQ